MAISTKVRADLRLAVERLADTINKVHEKKTALGPRVNAWYEKANKETQTVWPEGRRKGTHVDMPPRSPPWRT